MGYEPIQRHLACACYKICGAQLAWSPMVEILAIRTKPNLKVVEPREIASRPSPSSGETDH